MGEATEPPSDVRDQSNAVPRSGSFADLVRGVDVPCPHCSFNLRGLNDPKCPECGRHIDIEVLRKSLGKQGGVFSRLGPAGPLAIFAAIAPPLGTIALFATAGVTVPWLREQGSLGVWIYAAAFAVCTGLALLPTYAQSGLAGYAFGVVNGSIASIVGFLVGSLVGYAIASRVSGERIVRLSEENPKFAAIRRALVGQDGPSCEGAKDHAGATAPKHFWRTLGLVTLLRVPPNSPFAVMNLALASLRVPRLPFVLGTAIGMAPRTILAAALGSWIAGSQSGGEFTSDAWYAAAPRWLYFVGLGVTILVLLVMTVLANRVIARAAKEPRTDNSGLEEERTLKSASDSVSK